MHKVTIWLKLLCCDPCNCYCFAKVNIGFNLSSTNFEFTLHIWLVSNTYEWRLYLFLNDPFHLVKLSTGVAMMHINIKVLFVCWEVCVFLSLLNFSLFLVNYFISECILENWKCITKSTISRPTEIKQKTKKCLTNSIHNGAS